MKLRVSFEIDVPPETRMEVVQVAARQALLILENTVESATDKGAQAGTCRVTLKFNQPMRKVR